MRPCPPLSIVTIAIAIAHPAGRWADDSRGGQWSTGDRFVVLLGVRKWLLVMSSDSPRGPIGQYFSFSREQVEACLGRLLVDGEKLEVRRRCDLPCPSFPQPPLHRCHSCHTNLSVARVPRSCARALSPFPPLSFPCSCSPSLVLLSFSICLCLSVCLSVW